jgi:hypothetical protein
MVGERKRVIIKHTRRKDGDHKLEESCPSLGPSEEMFDSPFSPLAVCRRLESARQLSLCASCSSLVHRESECPVGAER